MPALLEMQPLIADADGFGHMNGFGWSVMTMGWLMMFAIIGLVVWSITRASTGSSGVSSDRVDSAHRILADRFARGDIDADEYRRRSDELGS
jgi:putative membrane protein